MTNWNDYRFLLAVHTYGSFAAAAQRLGVSQPTVSRRITALEQDLKLILLDRSSDGARLSQAGLRICEEARTLEWQAGLIELSARNVRRNGPSRVRVTASEGLASVALVPLFTQLNRERPDIAVDLSAGNKLMDIRRRAADIAIRFGDPLDETLIGRKVGETHFGLFAHESYLQKYGAPGSIDDLSNHAIIESSGEIASLHQSVWLRTAARDARIAISCNSVFNQLSALQTGMGLLAMATYLAHDLPEIQRLLPDVFNPKLDVWLLFEPHAADSPAIRAVIDFLADEMRRYFRRSG